MVVPQGSEGCAITYGLYSERIQSCENQCCDYLEKRILTAQATGQREHLRPRR
jgi:hypothetical protein